MTRGAPVRRILWRVPAWAEAPADRKPDSTQVPFDLGVECGRNGCTLPAGHDADTFGWHADNLDEGYAWAYDPKGRRLRGVPIMRFWCSESGCHSVVFQPHVRTCDDCQASIKAKLHRAVTRTAFDRSLRRPRRLR